MPKFNDSGPIIKDWRALYGFLQDAFHQDGGGSWQTIQPQAPAQTWLGQPVTGGIK
jgi:hypothetical protein